MQNSVTPLHVARLARRVTCPERLGFFALRYLRCQRLPGHPGKCWADGWSWWVVGHDQDRRYEPSKPAPGDVSAPWTPRPQRGAGGRKTRPGLNRMRRSGHGLVRDKYLHAGDV